MSVTITNPTIPEAVAYQLMNDLLAADGKATYTKGDAEAATRQEIEDAYKTALKLVRGFKTSQSGA